MLKLNRIRFPLTEYFNHGDKRITAIDYTFLFDLKIANIRRENTTQALRDSLQETIGTDFTPRISAPVFYWDPEDRFGRKITLTASLIDNTPSITLDHVIPILKAANRKAVITDIKPYGYSFYSLQSHRIGWTPITEIPEWFQLPANTIKGTYIDCFSR